MSRKWSSAGLYWSFQRPLRIGVVFVLSFRSPPRNQALAFRGMFFCPAIRLPAIFPRIIHFRKLIVYGQSATCFTHSRLIALHDRTSAPRAAEVTLLFGYPKRTYRQFLMGSVHIFQQRPSSRPSKSRHRPFPYLRQIKSRLGIEHAFCPLLRDCDIKTAPTAPPHHPAAWRQPSNSRSSTPLRRS